MNEEDQARVNVCRKALAYTRASSISTTHRLYYELVQAVLSWERLEPELATHEPQPPNPDAD